MKSTATISEKYQMVIPQKIRQALGIHVGDKIIFSLCEGKAIIEREPTLQEKRERWLKNALNLYATDNHEPLWGPLDNEDFHD
jgi:AbrB family looped-hinge helix DNA binding protein